MKAGRVMHSRPQRHRGQRGQTVVIIGFLILFMLLLLGLVIDSTRLYIVTAQAERAAEAGALAGALYMPNYFDSTSNPPSPDGHNAVERVGDAVKQNGITNCPVSLGQVGATPVQDSVNPYKLEVTITIQADVFFLAYVAPNLSNTTVSRTAAAQYLPPIQLGSRASYFGDEIDKDGSGNPLQYFWARVNGPLEPQEFGDAYTPTFQEGPTDPINYPDASSSIYPFNRWTPSVCCTNHQQWAGGAVPNPDQQPPGFTGDQGVKGYNYQIVVPPGTTPVEIQIYNPAFDPPTTLGSNTSESLGNACNDPTFNTGGCKTDQPNEYLQMAYSLYLAPLPFERNTDTLLTAFYPASLDLASGDLSKHSCTSSQAYDPQAGACVTKPTYINSWYPLPIANTNQPYIITNPGTYRLALETTGGYGYHQYAIKITNIQGNMPPSGVRLWAWNDECVYFNVSGANSTFDLGEIPASYAGKTLNFSLFDPGDVNGNNYMEILDQTGTPVQLPSWLRTVMGSGGTELNASTNSDYNGLWLHIPITIPSTYNPSPGSDWWQVKYIVPPGSTPSDTITISVTLSGSPIHLVQLLD